MIKKMISTIMVLAALLSQADPVEEAKEMIACLKKANAKASLDSYSWPDLNKLKEPIADLNSEAFRARCSEISESYYGVSADAINGELLEHRKNVEIVQLGVLIVAADFIDQLGEKEIEDYYELVFCEFLASLDGMIGNFLYSSIDRSENEKKLNQAASERPEGIIARLLKWR